MPIKQPTRFAVVVNRSSGVVSKTQVRSVATSHDAGFIMALFHCQLHFKFTQTCFVPGCRKQFLCLRDLWLLPRCTRSVAMLETQDARLI